MSLSVADAGRGDEKPTHHLRAAVAALDGVLSSAESEPTEVSAQESAQERVAVDTVSANSLK
jgi:hypothetical protein